MKTTYTGKLAIFTSFYSHLAYAPYVRSLATTLGGLSALGIRWDYLCRLSDFHIERAVNNTLTEIMERDDFTDVLLIDSDESWELEGVLRLLAHPEEIVGASYRMKNSWDHYVGRPIYRDGLPVGRMLADGTPLLEADRVAGGFMRIKVSALRKWAAAYPELVSEEPDGKKVQFFSRMLADGEMHCQDMAFCRRWLDIGGKLWIDPNIKVGHWGMTCYEGDLVAKMKGDHAPKLTEKEAFEMVAQMAQAIEQRKAA